MPIRVLIENDNFPPKEATMLIAAFEDTLRALGLVDREDPMTLLVARHVIALAKAGERDPVQLRDLTLKAIREQ